MKNKNLRINVRLLRLLLAFHAGAKPLAEEWSNSTINDLCRRLEDFAPIYASKAAMERAKKSGIDLRRFQWRNQNRMNGPHRSVFHWEHLVPVKDLRERLLFLPARASVRTIARIVGDASIAWLLKREVKRVKHEKGRKTLPEALETFRKSKVGRLKKIKSADW